MAFLADLARKRSLASAALLFLMLIDEMEGLVFVALGVMAQRMDLFQQIQDVLFPVIVAVSAVVTAVRYWRQREPKPAPPPLETLELSVLAQRIGVAR